MNCHVFDSLQMDQNNLCLVFGPTVIRKADDTGLVCDMKACYKVMEFFMVHVSFPGSCKCLYLLVYPSVHKYRFLVCTSGCEAGTIFMA